MGIYRNWGIVSIDNNYDIILLLEKLDTTCSYIGPVDINLYINQRLCRLKEGEKIMEEYGYKQLRIMLTYIVVFAVVSATTILRLNDKISPDLTGVIFGFILGIMLGVLGNMQREWLKKEE